MSNGAGDLLFQEARKSLPEAGNNAFRILYHPFNAAPVNLEHHLGDTGTPYQ
jgi:hypothetical protein